MSQTLTPVILGFAVVPADSQGAAGSLTAPGSKGGGGGVGVGRTHQSKVLKSCRPLFCLSELSNTTPTSLSDFFQE